MSRPVVGHASVEFLHEPTPYIACDEERTTSRILPIADAGTLVREHLHQTSNRIADQRDPAQAVRVADPGVIAREAAGSALEVGMFAIAAAGHVTAAWAKSDAQVPAVIFGVEVK